MNCCPEVHRHRSHLTSATAIQSLSCHQNFLRGRRFLFLSFFLSTFFHFHRTLFMHLRMNSGISNSLTTTGEQWPHIINRRLLPLLAYTKFF